ncbi:MAG: DUF4386 domain-containing protein [Anaerolineales bacterium]|nr:DUF4386 domain-containing protein [Anaerolineales bacterium]
MTPQANASLPAAPSIRRAALIAGLGLLAMIILAPFANFYVLESLVVPGDAQATTANLMASPGLLRLGIAAFLAVVLLDVIVAWALYDLLAPVSQSVARLAAWFRVAYAAVYAVALASLLSALRLTAELGDLTALDPAFLQAQVMLALNGFNTIWNLGLALFGMHLLIVGALVLRSNTIPRWLGVVVAIAGLGYLVDSFGRLLLPSVDLGFVMITFFGEALFMVWLLWHGLRRG